MLLINGVETLPAMTKNNRPPTNNCARQLKMRITKQKIARNKEKNSTAGYKNCAHPSTNVHPPIRTVPYYDSFWFVWRQTFSNNSYESLDKSERCHFLMNLHKCDFYVQPVLGNKDHTYHWPVNKVNGMSPFKT